MNPKIIGPGLLFLLFCFMEVGALIEYLKFPNVQSLHIGLAFAVVGAVFLVCSIRLYRSNKRNT